MNYTEESFWKKIGKYSKKAGHEVIYRALVLFYVLKKKDTPTWVKSSIVGALGYFIFPFDALFDPIFVDDLAVLAAALVAVSKHVDEEVNKQANNKFKSIFGVEYLRNDAEQPHEKIEKK